MEAWGRGLPEPDSGHITSGRPKINVSASDFPRTCSGNYSHDRATHAAGQNRHFEDTPFRRDIKSAFAPLAVATLSANHFVAESWSSFCNAACSAGVLT